MDYQSYLLTPLNIHSPVAPVKPTLKSTNPTVTEIEAYLEALKNAPTKEDMDNYSRACMNVQKMRDEFNHEQAKLMKLFIVDVHTKFGFPIPEKIYVNPTVKDMKKCHDKLERKYNNKKKYEELTKDIDMSVWNIPEADRKFIIEFLNCIHIRDEQIETKDTPENEEMYRKIVVTTLDPSELEFMDGDGLNYKGSGKVYTTTTRVKNYIIQRLGGRT